MASGGIGGSLLRWWWLTLLGLAVTGGLAAAAFVAVPPTQQARTDILLIPAATEKGVNPYLALGGLGEVAEVLGKSLSDDQTLESLESQHFTAKYSADRDVNAAGPFVVVVAEDKDPAMAMRTMAQVASLVPPRLAQLQQSLSVPTHAFITSKVISVDDKPKVVRRSQIRAVIAATAAGLVGTLGLVSLAERMTLTRRRRPPRQSPPERERDDIAREREDGATPRRPEKSEKERQTPAARSGRAPEPGLKPVPVVVADSTGQPPRAAPKLHGQRGR